MLFITICHSPIVSGQEIMPEIAREATRHPGLDRIMLVLKFHSMHSANL